MTQPKYYDGERFKDAVQFRDIPEPVGNPLFWWPMTNGWSSDSTGFGQGTVHGAEWVRGNYAGGWALNGDGIDDYVRTTSWGGFGSSMNSGYSIAVTVKFSHDDDGRVLNVFSENPLSRLDIRVNQGGSGGTDIGNIACITRDSNEDYLTTDAGRTDLNDGSRYRIIVVVDNPENNEMSMYVNGDTQPENDSLQDGPTDFVDFNRDVVFMARNDGSLNIHLEAVIDNVIVYDRPLTTDDIEEDYRRQPWSEVN